MNSRTISTPVANGFICPNDVIDEIMAFCPDLAFRCYLVIMRKTIGWQKTSDRIAVSQFMKLTGKKKSAVCEALGWLENANLIKRTRGDDCRECTEYALNRDPNSVVALPTKRDHKPTVSAQADSENSDDRVSAQADRGVRPAGPTKYTNYNIQKEKQNASRCAPISPDEQKQEQPPVGEKRQPDPAIMPQAHPATKLQRMAVAHWKRPNGSPYYKSARATTVVALWSKHPLADKFNVRQVADVLTFWCNSGYHRDPIFITTAIDDALTLLDVQQTKRERQNRTT